MFFEDTAIGPDSDRVREHDCLSTASVAAADDGEKQTDFFPVCYV